MDKITKINEKNDDNLEAIIAITKLLAEKETVRDNKDIRELLKVMTGNALGLNNMFTDTVIEDAINKELELIKVYKTAIKALERVRYMDSKNND